MTVSIALATYNGAAFLQEQLASLRDQTLQPLELVVADDGSHDSTVSVVRSFAETAPFPVTVIDGQGRLGYRLNFRRAAQACRGDLIAFCDQDDVWHHDKLAVMTKCFDDPAILLAYHNAKVVSGDGSRLLFRGDEERRSLCGFQPFKEANGLLQVFRASLRRFDDLWDRSLDQNEGNVILAHDQWYFFLALLLGRVEFVDRALLDYRQHGSNTYGVKLRDTALSRFLRHFKHYGNQDIWAGESAKQRAEIAKVVGHSEDRDDVRLKADLYGQLAKRLQRRAQTYCAASPIARARSLAQSWSCGDYAGAELTFRPNSLVRDFWSGVLLKQVRDPTR